MKKGNLPRPRLNAPVVATTGQFALQTNQKKETSRARVMTRRCRKVSYLFILSIPKARRLHSREAVFQIGDDVVDVLCSDREADSVRVDSCRVKLVVGEL